MSENVLILCVKYKKFIYNVDPWTPVASTSWIVSIIIKFMQWNIYIYIYIQNKQIQFDHNTKHTTSITKPKEKKKYQPPQNYKQRFRTHKSNKK